MRPGRNQVTLHHAPAVPGALVLYVVAMLKIGVALKML